MLNNTLSSTGGLAAITAAAVLASSSLSSAAVVNVEYDALTVTNGDTVWVNNVNSGSRDASFGPGGLVTFAGDPSPTGIDASVLFDGSNVGSITPSFNPTPDRASIEIWFKPALADASNFVDGVLFETGGASKGLMVGINGATGSESPNNPNSIVAAIGGLLSADGKQILTVPLDISAADDFVHVVLTVGADGSKLYVNGALADSDATVNDDWAGSNAGALGGTGGGNLGAGGSTGSTILPGSGDDFEGEIGLFRFYGPDDNDVGALTAQEVSDLYLTVVPEPSSALMGIVGAGLLAVRRRRG
ncbi:MAG: LamG-like jellyroll fold domain-containing protein [Planctomycetota bacterium]